MKDLLKHFTKRNIFLICLGLFLLFVADMFFAMDMIAVMLLFVLLGFSCFAYVIRHSK